MEEIVLTPEYIVDERIQNGIKQYLVKRPDRHKYGISWQQTSWEPASNLSIVNSNLKERTLYSKNNEDINQVLDEIEKEKISFQQKLSNYTNKMTELYEKNIKNQKEKKELSKDCEFLLNNIKLNIAKSGQIKKYKSNIKDRHDILIESIYLREKHRKVLDNKLTLKKEKSDDQKDELKKVQITLKEENKILIRELRNLKNTKSQTNIKSTSSRGGSKLYGKDESLQKEINLLKLQIMLKEETLSMTKEKSKEQQLQNEFLSDL